MDDVFAADPDVALDLRAVDWAATPLGPVRDWPQSLQTAVSILLSSKFPMWMAWGPQLTFFCNAAYRRDTLGHKYPWALGRPANQVWAEIWDDIGPRIDTVLATGQATWDEALLLFLERSGYQEETYHTFSYSPLRDESGVAVGMLCVVSEDTTRVVSERRMATLRDLGSDPSVVRTEEETLAFASRQLDRNQRDLPFTLTYLIRDRTALLAGTTGIQLGHAVAVSPIPLDGPDPIWPATLTGTEPHLVDLAQPRYAGIPSGIWPLPPTQAVLIPLLRQGGAPYGFLVAGLNRYRPFDDGYRSFVELVAGHVATGIASARSYQAQQRRAEELAELDRAKTVFFSNISHEFRTPLTLIMGPIDDLRRRSGTDPAVQEELDVIHRNGLRLGKLVNSLLDFSRLEAGRMQASYEPVDLAAVTAELASVFRSAVEKAGLRFTVDCPPLDQPVYIDRGMWEKVILNLLSNALKFTFEGSVGVSVSRDHEYAIVSVTDTGIGIAADQMPRLFERFHRVENARSRSNEGSGIGLALVQELVGLHGGTITAHSAEGEGTRFTISVPFGHSHLPARAIVAATSSAALSAAAEPYVQEALRWVPDESSDTLVGASDQGMPAFGPGLSRPATVLVADDNADMRAYLARLLSGAGYRVRTVDDGRHALDAARAKAPDLIISDVMMPRLDGLQLLIALRADPRTEAIPVMLLSARAGQEASIEGLQAGADDYLVKPFSAAELLARVRASVQLARTRNHHARWRTALINSLQEAFFVCDETGAVIEINTAFTEILGFGPEGLPYQPTHPWWPDPGTDEAAYREVAAAFDTLLQNAQGTYTIPVTHSAGHRVWVNASFNRAQDPDSGRTVTVGTFRDVTAEHYAIQRDTAMAALNLRLSQAPDLAQAVTGALTELQHLWHAGETLGVVFRPGAAPALSSARGEPVSWEQLPEGHRTAIADLRDGPNLTAAVAGGDGAGIRLEHPHGVMVLWLDLAAGRRFTEHDRLLLSLLAGSLAQGLTRVHQIDQQRETALALQRAILGPSELPHGFAVRYEPAASPLEIGGDWYDTIALPDGRIGIVVGDCVGRGLAAAAVMGQLRSACRALLLQDPSPARTLMTMDHFAAAIPGARCTTVFCGVLDLETGQLTYASAGHPPGIIAHRDGKTDILSEGRSLPLAVRLGASRGQAEHTMPARATMMLYTDGLVERRRGSMGEGIDNATNTLHQGRDIDIEQLAAHVMDSLAPSGGFDDDVAFLLYRQPGPLQMTFPAEAGQLAPVRNALRDWLHRCALPSKVAHGILIAAGEACANAIEHGHRGNPGEPIRLRAEAYADGLRLTIADTGRWKSPTVNTDRGRGVGLMRAIMQHVNIDSSSTGTTVDMYTRIAE
ncbi:PAS domain S-box-containing protein [Allocatelliglobosispora scoriae]|uniref:histidine kinase n=1 Tax=Allocatelliglobosispora scoriae TaxID=643052 RepID=A0A841C3Q7_9ACTN|nr:SpoIIE family protein phosphatase [Allocatelliglobosispora scoriae]MBB5873692.1 PAS domain S-box-containing protein [Allocatelliglobosispora scoriae]